MNIHGMEGNTELGVWRVEDIVCFQFFVIVTGPS